MGEICSAVENTLWRDFHAGLLIVKWVIDIRSSLSPLAEKRRVSDRQFRLGRALPLVGLNSKLGAGWTHLLHVSKEVTSPTMQSA